VKPERNCVDHLQGDISHTAALVHGISHVGAFHLMAFHLSIPVRHSISINLNLPYFFKY